jgi:hypothetical protein
VRNREKKEDQAHVSKQVVGGGKTVLQRGRQMLQSKSLFHGDCGARL